MDGGDVDDAIAARCARFFLFAYLRVIGCPMRPPTRCFEWIEAFAFCTKYFERLRQSHPASETVKVMRKTRFCLILAKERTNCSGGSFAIPGGSRMDHMLLQERKVRMVLHASFTDE